TRPGLPVIEVVLSKSDLTAAWGRELTKLRSLQKLSVNTSMVIRASVTDSGLKHLPSLPSLQALNLHGTHVSDAGMKHIAALPALEHLATSADLSEAGLRSLAKLQSLRKLRLSGTQAAEAALKHLGRFKDLNTLELFEGTATDAVLERLSELKSLRKIWV